MNGTNDTTTERGATPGPWKAYGLLIDSESGRNGEGVIERICTMDDGPTEEESDANARLIAAAPDLLAALQGMVARFASHSSGRQDPNEPAQARAAIAKATGEK